MEKFKLKISNHYFINPKHFIKNLRFFLYSADKTSVKKLYVINLHSTIKSSGDSLLIGPRDVYKIMQYIYHWNW